MGAVLVSLDVTTVKFFESFSNLLVERSPLGADAVIRLGPWLVVRSKSLCSIMDSN